MRHRKKFNHIDLNDIMIDYTPDETIFSRQTDKFKKLTDIIQNQLTTEERNIILLYAETASVRETAKTLGVSSALIYQDIQQIRHKIKNLYALS